ncbi:cytochrome C [Anaeromyxobacter terrae]|uniref:cytochrome C n=1 Tax=Anaeromyxobacter terrae TaxID=2925406 RepID=UPI001F567AEB|nr:cytochrome C [Anaeromyxobacter sp. SG22]
MGRFGVTAWAAGLASAAAVALTVGVPARGAGNGDGGDSRIQRGFAIAPVELNLEGKNRGLVGLGSYLVNAVGGCNDCHTNPPYAPGGNPFLGEPKQVNAAHYLAGGMAFGPFISANITPDSSGRPEGLTLDEFKEVMRTGVDPDSGMLLQVMPWPVYGQMTDRDLEAIYAYLTEIPHAEPAAP